MCNINVTSTQVCAGVCCTLTSKSAMTDSFHYINANQREKNQ